MTNKYFYKNKNNGIDGFNPYCIKCTKNRTNKWREDNPEKHKLLYIRRNSTPKQKESMKIAAKNQHENGYFKNYQQENKDKFNEYSKDKRENRTHKISDNEWEDCKKYFNHRCAYCNLKIEDHYIKFKGKLILGDFHKEHVDDNGSNDLSNCIPSCKSCNSQKWEFEFDKWYIKDNPVFNEERKNKIIKWLNEDYELYTKN